MAPEDGALPAYDTCGGLHDGSGYHWCLDYSCHGGAGYDNTWRFVNKISYRCSSVIMIIIILLIVIRSVATPSIIKDNKQVMLTTQFYSHSTVCTSLTQSYLLKRQHHTSTCSCSIQTTIKTLLGCCKSLNLWHSEAALWSGWLSLLFSS